MTVVSMLDVIILLQPATAFLIRVLFNKEAIWSKGFLYQDFEMFLSKNEYKSPFPCLKRAFCEGQEVFCKLSFRLKNCQ